VELGVVVEEQGNCYVLHVALAIHVVVPIMRQPGPNLVMDHVLVVVRWYGWAIPMWQIEMLQRPTLS